MTNEYPWHLELVKAAGFNLRSIKISKFIWYLTHFTYFGQIVSFQFRDIKVLTRQIYSQKPWCDVSTTQEIEIVIIIRVGNQPNYIWYNQFTNKSVVVHSVSQFKRLQTNYLKLFQKSFLYLYFRNSCKLPWSKIHESSGQ